MRKFCALLIAGLLAGSTLVNPASSQPRWQYGGWQQSPGGQWRWVGAWGPRGRWVRQRGNWVYRSPVPPWQVLPLGQRAGRPLGMARRLGAGRPMGALPRRLGLPLALAVIILQRPSAGSMFGRSAGPPFTLGNTVSVKVWLIV